MLSLSDLVDTKLTIRTIRWFEFRVRRFKAMLMRGKTEMMLGLENIVLERRKRNVYRDVVARVKN